MRQVLDALTGAAAFVRNDRLDILAVNRLGRVLYADALDSAQRKANLARFIFFDPRAARLYADADGIARAAVGSLRAAAGRDPSDSALTALVRELSGRSEKFRSLWAEHDVEYYRSGVQPFRHPQAGEFTLNYDAFELPADPGLTMIVYTAEQGTPAYEALSLLSSLAAVPAPNVPAQESGEGYPG